MIAEFLIWLAIFIISLTVLIKASEWIASNIQKIAGNGLNSEWAIISIAAALPETAAAAAAVLQGQPEMAAAIIIGSSVANILLVVGITAAAAKSLTIKKDHVENDLPLFAAAAAVFYFSASDGQIVFGEGVLMLAVFLAYAAYVFSARRREFGPQDIITPHMITRVKLMETVGTRIERSLKAACGRSKPVSVLVMAVIGSVFLITMAANFTVESLAEISGTIGVSAAILAMTVLALTAALPELSNSLSVIAKKRYEVALGNIFAATTTNLLLVPGIAALFAPLPFYGAVRELGLPFLAVSCGLLIVSAISRKIDTGHGIMYIFLYLFFFAKLLNLF